MGSWRHVGPNRTRVEFTWAQSIRITQIWKMVHAAIVDHGDIAARAARTANTTATVSVAARSELRPLPRELPGAELAARSDRTMDKAGEMASSTAAADAAAAGESTSGAAARESGSQSPAAEGGGGACYCYCGVAQAIGKCFAAATESACDLSFNETSVTSDIRAYCPNITSHFDCFDEPAPCRTMPRAAETAGRSDSPRPRTPPHKPHPHLRTDKVGTAPLFPQDLVLSREFLSRGFLAPLPSFPDPHHLFATPLLAPCNPLCTLCTDAY